MATAKFKPKAAPPTAPAPVPPTAPAPAVPTDLGEARPRAMVDAVLPAVDAGRFAVKRVVGEALEVRAHCFADGHDKLRVMLRWYEQTQHEAQAPQHHEVEMQPLGNDEWRASFVPPTPGPYRYTVLAWVDHFLTWRDAFARRVDTDDVRVAALTGAELIAAAAERANGADRRALKAWSSALRQQASADPPADTAALRALALEDSDAHIAARYPDRSAAAMHEPALPLAVDRERAGFSTWYELFPRSAAADAGRHGNFADVQARLPSIAEMGFDVLYLPPIHPIGRHNRKGKNNTLTPEPDDVGSPWAIGAAEGGHKSILPALGTADDFRRLVAAANAQGIEIALDIALQCAPDHPYVTSHPQWFRKRPDGSIQYAENPPKKYQDIYPFDFETDDWQALWQELKSIFDHWIEQGVRIFRVDNPHTKSFAFWQWAIAEIKREHADVLFLAEAFTRPKVMHRLAKLGFSQSYTYYTWRNTRHELTEYFTELSQGPGVDYYRPNAWPNTPDILSEHLHGGGRPIFGIRLVLAATLAPNYGIYGPAFELMENTPREPGSEEYLNSEKYQLRHWDVNRPDSLRGLITRINRIRHENPALQSLRSLRFLHTDNDQLIAYIKRSADGDNLLLVVVNLDTHNPQSGWVDVGHGALPVDTNVPFQLHDLLSDQRFMWQGPRGYILLDPRQAPAHVFRVRQRLRSERDYDRGV